MEYVIRHGHDRSAESNNRLLVSTYKTLQEQRQAYRNITSKRACHSMLFCAGAPLLNTSLRSNELFFLRTVRCGSTSDLPSQYSGDGTHDPLVCDLPAEEPCFSLGNGIVLLSLAWDMRAAAVVGDAVPT